MGLEKYYKEGQEKESINQQTVQQNNTNKEQEFVDNSPEAIEARKLQDIADNSLDNLAMIEWIAGLNTEEETNTTASTSNNSNPPPTLKSPLFKQHQRLRSLLVNPQDHFTKGSSGEGVFAIQQALKKLYPQATIGQYGIYGKQTIILVKKFQQEEGLGNDGDFGRQTLLALDQYSFSRIVINEEGSKVERVEGFEVQEEINRPAKISATANDLAIAQGQQTLTHQDQSEDKGIHHNQEVSGVRIYSDPTKESKMKFTLHYDTDVTLVGEYAYESSWSLIQTTDGREGWINSNYVTQGTTATAPNLAQSELTMISQDQKNLGDVVQDRYGSSFVQEHDARLIIQAIAFMNDGRSAIYYKEEEHTLSWWERMLLNSTEEEARSIYQNIGIRSEMNIMLPSEALILQMKEAGLVSSGSIKDQFQGAIDFLHMYGGYQVGLLEGLWDGLVGTLQAFPDLLQMIWDVVKSLFQGTLVSKLAEIISAIWEFIKNLPQTADNWWQEFKQKSPFEQGRAIGNGVGVIAFEVILAIFTAGAVNAIKAAGVGAKIIAASSKIKNTIGRFGDDLAIATQHLMGEIAPSMIELAMPNGFKINGRDFVDNDRPQNMRMDGDKDGVGLNKKTNQHKLDDQLDEHDLGRMSEEERNNLFKRDANRGIYRGQRIRTDDKAHLLELDRVDIKNKVIVEDKNAKGFDRNPKGIDVAIDNWINKNLYKNAKKKIDFIENKSDHVFYDTTDKLSSPYLPDISDIQQIKSIKYKLRATENAYDGKLKTKIEETIDQLKEDYPEWTINVEYK